MKPKSELELEQQLKNEHATELQTFTRTLLTTSSGCLALLAGLHGKNPIAASSLAFRAGWLFLLASVLIAFVVQWQFVMAPLYHWAKARKLSEDAQARGSTEPIVLRRLPPRGHAKLIAIQAATFAAAFVCLTFAMLW